MKNNHLNKLLSKLNNTLLGRFLPIGFKDRVYIILNRESDRTKLTNHVINPTETELQILREGNSSDIRECRPCHFKQLYVRSNGEVYPCCRVWPRKEMMIGHITDDNLIDKIMNYDPANCSCKKYIIRKSNKNDAMKYFNINLELSLACQAKCAMCCVDAPGWSGVYNYYNDVELLIENIGEIDKLVFQGGEILVQSESISFIEKLKSRMPPNTQFSVITNGNINIENIDKIEKIFDRMMISIVGFQAETYKKIMGIELDKTIEFAENIARRGKIELVLKYLLTPINYHEQNIFLHWAFKQTPKEIVICDATWRQYINENVEDRYWDKIIARTVDSVVKEILSCDVDRLRKNNTILSIENLEHYNIDSEFIARNKLIGIIKEYDT